MSAPAPRRPGARSRSVSAFPPSGVWSLANNKRNQQEKKDCSGHPARTCLAIGCTWVLYVGQFITTRPDPTRTEPHGKWSDQPYPTPRQQETSLSNVEYQYQKRFGNYKPCKIWKWLARLLRIISLIFFSFFARRQTFRALPNRPLNYGKWCI